jgi:cold shock protein
VATGRILQFDEARGYGFVAADDGGEDVFLHTSVIQGDFGALKPGTRVEFHIMAGDRGRKAYGARILDQQLPSPEVPAPEPELAPAQEEAMCDVLSSSEFTSEITELLLNSGPGLTAGQIVMIRGGMLDFAIKRGWVDS